ncbi:MAG: hypothetical protein M1497_11365 [Nitrospirae bacterium]|nr:hypothetical protein [Nitrospirota bacterium]
MDRLNEILPYMREQRCGLFIGAGLSKIAGCYDWNSIVREMFTHSVVTRKGIKLEELPSDSRNEDLILFYKQLFIEGNEEDAFWGIARRVIYPEPELFKNDYLPLIKKLNQMSPKPKIMITTNIDDCLESTKEYDLS